MHPHHYSEKFVNNPGLPAAVDSPSSPVDSHHAPARVSVEIQDKLRSVRNILLVRLRSLGDAVLMTPVPRYLRDAFPSARISVLIEEPYAPVFRRHPDVDEVIALPEKDSLFRRAAVIFHIRRKRFDLVINMHSGPTAGLFTALSGAGVRVAYSAARYARWCNVRVPGSRAFWNADRIHTVEHQISPLLYLGVSVPEEIELVVELDPTAEQAVRGRMKELKVHPGRYVLMHPFATSFTKEWSLFHFAELARRLQGIYQVPILATAGRAELEKLERLVSVSGGLILGLPSLSLEELTVWIDQCGLFIGNDSGPTHLAAARKKKIVVLWGSSDYQAWHPWAGDYQLLRADLPCIPCPGDRCYQFDTPKCIESVSVDHAVHAVERLRPFV
ncbi:MAG TPA: glycosyltransferase family 9 protein [Acidobacteriota bacterium]|jgi:ADP-heptose:LPS heptosyltransferase|nr:glycosyltransferase family 9 protein [Acidobacteriota bacterium]